MVKMYTDLIFTGVVVFSWFDLNFSELSVQEEFWGFNICLNKELEIVWNIENYSRTVLISSASMNCDGKKESLSTKEHTL